MRVEGTDADDRIELQFFVEKRGVYYGSEFVEATPAVDEKPDEKPDQTLTPPVRFVRGDCNGDGQVTGSVTDAALLLRYNFAGGKEPPCLAACDANGDGQVVGGVTDAVFILKHNFRDRPAPVAPYPLCDEPTLETDAALGCERSVCSTI